ncbi:MAG: hypothetical protein KatS3mg110_1875 [Pirellulaceae bacterium]|nr:MAG: hypothetical protein KatS3mg110_1875 [Pirellulaceae bacterium]
MPVRGWAGSGSLSVSGVDKPLPLRPCLLLGETGIFTECGAPVRCSFWQEGATARSYLTPGESGY